MPALPSLFRFEEGGGRLEVDADFSLPPSKLVGLYPFPSTRLLGGLWSSVAFAGSGARDR